jgi:hypothetical protein
MIITRLALTTAGGTATTLATTGVYVDPSITTDAKGRITAAESGSGGGSGTASGPSFPGSPATGERFFRTDRSSGSAVVDLSPASTYRLVR